MTWAKLAAALGVLRVPASAAGAGAAVFLMLEGSESLSDRATAIIIAASFAVVFGALALALTLALAYAEHRADLARKQPQLPTAIATFRAPDAPAAPPPIPRSPSTPTSTPRPSPRNPT